jgi:nucleotide-binding universal stress UspA family protein
LYLARRLSCELVGVHVLDSRMLEGPLMADISGWIGAQPYGNQLQQFREVLEKKGEAVMAAYNERCVKAELPESGVIRMGHPAAVILEEEEKVDAVVLGQRGIHADLLGESMGSTTEKVVRHSAKPCMVTPAAFKTIGKILAAYDGSEHAGHALQVAVEWAKALQVELLVLTAADENDGSEANRLAQAGREQAEQSGCKAVHMVAEHQRPADAILESALEQGCDLVVMGAYGHSRIREWILGSVTHQVLVGAKCPVLLVR